MHRYFFLIFFALCCHSFILKADSQKFYFRHLGLKDNLSQSSVLCIVQDRKGFMWFGTKDGLNRYDGSEFRNFIYNRNDTASLGNNVINALYENKDGKLWVGTDNGIYLYNPQKETFSRFKQTSQDGTIIEQPVVQISSDSKDNVWIAVKCQGIFCYNHQTNLLLHYPLPDSCQINSFCIDQQDAIWIGYTSKGLFYTEDSFKSLKQFLTETGENIFSDDPIFKILPENHNTLYVGSAKGGLQHLNILTRKVTNALPNEKNVFVRNIYPADEKNLWIATEQGIYIYNKETRKSKHIVHNPNDIYSISNNAIYSIYKDRENGIWIGSYFGGIDYYQDNYSKFEKHYPITGQESLSGKVVREFLEDASGNIWIGTEDGGLNIFNPKTRQTHPFLTHRLHYNIHGLCTDGKKLWIGTHTKGLYSLDLKTGHLRNYLMQHTENSLNSNSVYSIYHTSAGTLYIGTPAGLNIYHSDTDSFRRIHELDGNFIFSILEDKKGNEICFCVELPVKQEKTIRLQKENTEVAAARPGISQHKTDIRILIVEDDMEMQDFICKQISGTYEVLKACNGKEALQLLNEENDISLIVSDVMMPEMDGFELCRTLKTNIEYSHIPIILLTAKTTMQSKIQGIELGANDYIEKPFSTEYLLVRIANLLSNQDKLRQAFTSSPFVKAKTIALSKADEEFLDKLTETIQKNISEPDFNIDVLAEKMFMSRSSLHRKIKGIAQITPNEFIQLERLKTAARLIQSKEYRINEVCYLVGFSSPSYFAKCFQKQFGTLPKNFK